MNIKRTCLILIVTYFCLSSLNATANTKPNVVVSIPPFYALVFGVMKGVATPTLLVKQGGSPHHYALNPSELKTLSNADLIFWGGPYLESFLNKPLSNLNSKQMIVQLDKSPGVHWLNARKTPLFQDIPNTRDMHFWLDPNNALALIDVIKTKLIEAYPENRIQFETNAKALKLEIKKTDTELKKKLSKVSHKPYMVLHDGYHYFEAHYGLEGVGALTDHAELPSSIERMNKIRSLIKDKNVQCVFTEPQVNSKLVTSIVKDFHLKTGELDSLERPNEQGHYNYVDMLNVLSESFLSCLES